MKTTSVLLKNVGLALFSFALFVVISPFAHAQSSSSIAQSFTADSAQGDIVNGALVSTKGSQNTIELTTVDTVNRLVGAVDDKPLVSLSGSSKGVEVVLSGTTNVLVSDINGTIKSGDKITASPIAGVGMKATANGQVVGTAQDTFTSDTTRSITDRDGKSHTVHIGYVRTQIGIAAYQAPGSDLLPPFIQNMANNIAGRPVSLLRILICSVLLLLGFVTAAVLAYSSTRSAMTSLGRNPLASHAIRQGLYQTIVVSLVVVVAALLASYLILTV
ncbi:MAG TPA: hypothetical protein VJ843_00295 [Candidatus Saccharimonadales bacterium]|nr:hypothetical protein [Candidatus Saccharimonadales bacterium]